MKFTKTGAPKNGLGPTDPCPILAINSTATGAAKFD